MPRSLGVFLFIGYALLAVVFSPFVGVSWDEPDNIWASGVYINFFRSGMNPSILIDNDSSVSYFHNKIFTQVAELRRYPPVPLYLGAIIVLLWERFAGELSAQQIITAFHMASGAFWAILGVSAYYFARLFKISLVGSLLASLLIAFHPLLFGYGLSIIKDSAQVALFTLSLFLLVNAKVHDKPIFLFLGALVWGSAMATKMNAIYVPIIWGLWRITRMFLFDRHRWAQEARYLFQDVCVVGIGGITAMILFWPYLWKDPIGHFLEVFSYFLNVGKGYAVFWDGSLYKVGIGESLPWYPLAHILVGTPILSLVFISVGIITSAIFLLKRKKTDYSCFLLLFFWIAVPLGRSLSPYAAFYDGARHFLEVIPPIVLVSGWGIDNVSKIISRYIGGASRGYALIGLTIVSYLFVLHAFFFPYSAGYVNAFIRDPNAVVERDIAGLSMKEAVRKIDELVDEPKRLFAPIAGHLSWYYLNKNDMYVYSLSEANVAILVNKSSHVQKQAFDAQAKDLFEERYAITRGNSVFAWIYTRKH